MNTRCEARHQDPGAATTGTRRENVGCSLQHFQVGYAVIPQGYKPYQRSTQLRFGLNYKKMCELQMSSWCLRFHICNLKPLVSQLVRRFGELFSKNAILKRFCLITITILANFKHFLEFRNICLYIFSKYQNICLYIVSNFETSTNHSREVADKKCGVFVEEIWFFKGQKFIFSFNFFLPLFR